MPSTPGLGTWHAVLYDVVASPDGECVYGVPWNATPRLFRYWSEDRTEDRLCPPGRDARRTGPLRVACRARDAHQTLYIGTHGTRAHLLAAMLKQDTGVVYDIGAVPGATSIDALVVRGDQVFFISTGPTGSVLRRTRCCTGAFFIQEWEILRHPMEEVAVPFSAESPKELAVSSTHVT